MNRARALLDVLTGVPQEEVEAILSIIRRAYSWQDANKELEPYRILFDPDHPFAKTGAPAGFDVENGVVWLNPAYFGRGKDWQTEIEHELMHKEQMLRAYRRGGDLSQIASSHQKYFFDRHGQVRMSRYTTHPLEMQALARNAFSKARALGLDPEELLRTGKLARYAPLRPGDRARFLKYAWQIFQAERGLPESLDESGWNFTLLSKRLLAEQAADLMLDQAMVKMCAWCQKEFGLPPAPNTTHGICKRHAQELAAEAGMPAPTYPDEMYAVDARESHLEQMNPSILIRTGGRTICVLQEHEWVWKHDSQGRRIRGSERTGDWLRTRVGWYVGTGLMDELVLPPMAAHEAAQKFLYLNEEFVIDRLLEEQSGVFISASLTKESHRTLLERVPPVHPWVHAHHMTVAFNPDLERFESVYKPLLGQSLQLKVLGAAQDERGQAVRVEGQSENENPHITISCADGVPAKYSNELLARGWEPVQSFTLEAVVEARPLKTRPVTP